MLNFCNFSAFIFFLCKLGDQKFTIMKKAKSFIPPFFLFIAVLAAPGAFAQYRHNGYKHYKYGYEGYRNYGYYPVSVRYYPRNPYGPYANYPLYNSFYSTPYPFVHFGPAFGLRINILPFGYTPLYLGSSPYYYYQGIYYRPYPYGGYEVTAPPLGATVSSLPPDAKLTVINGQNYYELGGTFYQEELLPDNKLQYRVVGTDGVIETDGNAQNPNPGSQGNSPAQLVPGTRLNELPAGSKVVVIDQQKYFLSPDGIYFNEVIEGNAVRYEVTGK
jgi:hypothetical protein